MDVLASQSALVALAVAELMFVISHDRSVKIAFKRKRQRTKGEANQVANGLLRELLVDLLVSVPASVVVGLLVVRPILLKAGATDWPVDAMVGVLCYGFPYAALKQIMIKMCATVLKEFVSVADPALVTELQPSAAADGAELETK